MSLTGLVDPELVEMGCSVVQLLLARHAKGDVVQAGALVEPFGRAGRSPISAPPRS